jgi:transposase
MALQSVARSVDIRRGERNRMSRRTGKTDYWQDAPQPREQLVLFAETLEGRIPEDHPVRLLDEILSRLDWTDWESAYHGKAGQPPIHPSVMCKVLLFAMIRRIRSSRQMEYNLRHSIDFMWLASGRTIDHTTLSEFRRNNEGRLKDIYRQVVQLAVDLKVAKLGELCIDGTRVLAAASRYKTLTVEKAERLLEELDRQISTAMTELQMNDEVDDLFDDGEPTDQLPAELRDMKSRQEQLEAALAQLREMDESRKENGINPEKNPAQLPTTDPDSRILPNKEGGYAPNYTPMAVTETENGFIVGADVLIGNVEYLALMPMVETIIGDFGESPETMMGDSAYSNGETIEAMEEKEIELLSPLPRKQTTENPAQRPDPTSPVSEEDLDRLPLNSRTKRFSKEAFVYDEEADCFYCPAGKPLNRSGTEKIKRATTTIHRAVYQGCQCSDCPLADRCCTNPTAKRGRRVTRDDWEAARCRHEARMQQGDAKERYKRRQHYGETPFAVLKAVMSLRRFLLRGIEGVRQEWLWGCTAFNLQKLMRLWPNLRVTLPTTTVATED